MTKPKNPIRINETALKLLLGAVIITVVITAFTLSAVVLGVFTLSMVIVYSYRYSLKIIIQIKRFTVEFINSIVIHITQTKEIIIDGTIKKEG